MAEPTRVAPIALAFETIAKFKHCQLPAEALELCVELNGGNPARPAINFGTAGADWPGRVRGGNRRGGNLPEPAPGLRAVHPDEWQGNPQRDRTVRGGACSRAQQGGRWPAGHRPCHGFYILYVYSAVGARNPSQTGWRRHAGCRSAARHCPDEMGRFEQCVKVRRPVQPCEHRTACVRSGSL